MLDLRLVSPLLAAALLAPATLAGPPGTLGTHSGTGLHFIVDPNQGGHAPELKLVDVRWGRLVDVYDVNGVQRFADLLVGPNVASDGVNYLLEKHPITQAESLTILHPFPSLGFRQAFQQAQAGLVPLLDKGRGPGVLPPFTMVPRNATLVAIFDDLLDDGGEAASPAWPGTVTPENLRLWTGTPLDLPFQPRVIPDPSHGARRGGRFHSTRVLIDFTVSKLEAYRLGSSSVHAPVNSIGLPPSIDTAVANAVLRIPTQPNPAAAQFGILTNLAGNGLSLSGNGSNDPTSPTLDIVRAFRSGGNTAVTGDPFNGFLPDVDPPRILGSQVVSITAIQPLRDGLALDLQFQDPSCALTPRIGDVIEAYGTQVFEVAANAGAPQAGLVADVPVKVLWAGTPPTPGYAAYTTPWDPTAGAPPECFVYIGPNGSSIGSPGVSVNANVYLLFSEPMQPDSVEPFDAFSIRYDAPPPGASPLNDRVVGTMQVGPDLTYFVFQPTVPLANDGDPSTPDTYTVKMLGGPLGPRDLVGNPLDQALPPFGFSIQPGSPQVDSGSLSLRFSSVDEDGNGAPEIRGQFSHDFATEVVRPRPVTRFSAQADPKPFGTVWAMIPLSSPVQEPLSPLGSRMMAAWRYHDLGLGLLDESTHNIDVEGLWWEPFGGTVLPDDFDRFQMALSHSEFLPDEAISINLLPSYPASGLVDSFDANSADASKIVHPKAAGYTISPADLVQTPAGRVIAPWPLNRNVPPQSYQRWTWRDTAVDVVGAPNGIGADPKRLADLSPSPPVLPGFYDAGEVPTIGLPLLMEFRSYPTALAQGFNGFQVALAINSSANPYFRVFSSGGVTYSGQPLVVDPDQATVASGGVAPITGLPTSPHDNIFYYGQADFVVRVSRMHTIWLDTLGASQFGPPTIVPDSLGQPAGTQLILAWRGASSISSATPGSWADATNLDPYGNSYTADQHCQLAGLNPFCPAGALAFTPQYFPDPGDASWTANLTDLDGARYVQARVTFIADPVTGATPELSAVGISYTK